MINHSVLLISNNPIDYSSIYKYCSQAEHTQNHLFWKNILKGNNSSKVFYLNATLSNPSPGSVYPFI